MAASLTTLAAVDLNLLTAFLALAETRHVTRAARLLGVSQSALSHSLRRLRQVLGDPLFVRAASGIAFTPFAEAIEPAVREALGRLEHGVFSRRELAPAELSRTFRLRTTDFVEALLLPPLLARLADVAPRVKVAATAVGPALPEEELASGACDLAIAGFFEKLPDGMHRQALFEDRFTCAVSAKHPFAKQASAKEPSAKQSSAKSLSAKSLSAKPPISVSLEAFCESRHLIVAPGGLLSGAVDRALSRKKRVREVVAGTSAFLVSAWVCAESDCVLTAPSRLMALLGEGLGLRAFAPPVPLPSIKVAQLWHARSDADPAHRWFRSLVREIVSKAPTLRPARR